VNKKRRKKRKKEKGRKRQTSARDNPLFVSFAHFLFLFGKHNNPIRPDQI
jgi:hypothetical protein